MVCLSDPSNPTLGYTPAIISDDSDPPAFVATPTEPRRFSHLNFELVELVVAPDKTRCSDCGEECNRRQCEQRGPIYDVSLEGLRVLAVTVGVYACKNPGCSRKFFRKPLPFAPPRGRYTYRARRLGIDAVKIDGLPFSRATARLARELNVNPVISTVWEWHRAEGDLATEAMDLHRWTKESLSGVLCVDELYDGEFCLLMATDPLADITVGFQLVEKDKVDGKRVAEFLDYLSKMGAKPDVLVTDESKLYPAALRDSSWDSVLHQLCNFHFMQLVVKDVIAAVRAYVQTMPKDPKRKRGRPPKRGRPRSEHNKKRKAVQDARFLFSINPKNITEEQTEKLEAFLNEHPGLRTPREFAEKVYAMFGAENFERADEIRQEIITDERFKTDKDLAKSVARLEDEERFRKLVLYLEYENLDRTSNHVERDNRRYRKRQKSHYRLRLHDTIRNALNLKLDAERKATSGNTAPKLKPRETSAAK